MALLITVMGQPSASEPWGFQLDGHHVTVNYFVLGAQVAMTPFFVGSEPVTATGGKYKGISILQDEQNRGIDMLLALDKEKCAKAILNSNKTENYNLTEAFNDNVVIDYAGARVAEFSLPERRQLLNLVDLYVGNMDKRSRSRQNRWLSGTSTALVSPGSVARIPRACTTTASTAR
jgi:hypothetical protein